MTPELANLVLRLGDELDLRALASRLDGGMVDMERVSAEERKAYAAVIRFLTMQACRTMGARPWEDNV